ncbi:MAG TPA: transaldolase family protein [Terriglobales bacterium]|nr:transaldolase family protein [Terriglobales bacterium]
MSVEVARQSPLRRMTETTPTCLWNDSASVEELTSSIADGAVGATCNPVIVLDVLKREMADWKSHIQRLSQEMPSATEGEIGWRVVEDVSRRAADLLLPVFRKHEGRNGRLSIQTDPRLYRNTEALLEQAVYFSKLAPNIIVKLPATAAGIRAIEEATYRGVCINATVSFTLPQCIAVAEAVERGLNRRSKEGRELGKIGAVCTIMVGRLDDWLKIAADRDGITLDPGAADWAGVAVFKKAYRLFCERGYRMRLLSAAFRNHYHWSELIGGDIVISPPYKWQARFNQSEVPVVSRIQQPVEPAIVKQLCKLEDFRRAYEVDGMEEIEFDSYAPTVRTLRQFLAACHDLERLIRDFMLPEPKS